MNSFFLNLVKALLLPNLFTNLKQSLLSLVNDFFVFLENSVNHKKIPKKVFFEVT